MSYIDIQNRQIVNKNMNRCSTSLVFSKIQIKTGMRDNFTLTGISRINKQKIASSHKDVEELEPSHITGGNVKCSCYGKLFEFSSKS